MFLIILKLARISFCAFLKVVFLNFWSSSPFCPVAQFFFFFWGGGGGTGDLFFWCLFEKNLPS